MSQLDSADVLLQDGRWWFIGGVQDDTKTTIMNLTTLLSVDGPNLPPTVLKWQKHCAATLGDNTVVMIGAMYRNIPDPSLGDSLCYLI